MKIPMAFASMALLGGTLAACGGGDGGSADGDYCKELKKSTSSLSALADPAADWEENFKGIHDLADKAPGALADDWKTIDKAFGQLEKGLKKAGLKPSDMTKIGAGDTSGLSAGEAEKIVREFMKIGSDKVVKAFETVAKHAKDECKVDIDV